MPYLSADQVAALAELLSPLLESGSARRSRIRTCLGDERVVGQLDYGGSYDEFAERAFDQLFRFGTVKDGDNALVAVMRCLGKKLGPDKQRDLQVLIDVLAPPPAPSGGQRTFNPLPGQPAAGDDAGPIRQRWAFLVGVDRYVDPQVSTLKHCGDDVDALAVTLQKLGYTTVVLSQPAPPRRDPPEHRWPTLTNILAELRNLCEAIGRDDLIFVHFSCHGILLPAPERRAVLLAADTRVRSLERSGLPVAEVERILKQECKAARKVLSLDACHAGPDTGRDAAEEEERRAFYHQVYELATGYALLTASTSRQAAHEAGDLGLGVYTHYLIEGLQGAADKDQRGFVTVDDLRNYVLFEVQRRSVEKGLAVQKPTAGQQGHGSILLADRRERRAAPGGAEQTKQP